MATRLPAAARRRQLLDVAVGVFARRGFHATSMNDVAEAAGVTKPVLYQHFGSKRDLYLALLDDVGGRLRQAITAATAQAAGPREQVEAGFVAYFEFVGRSASAFQVLFGSGTRRDEDFADAARQVEESIAEAIAALIDVDLDAEHLDEVAHGIVGLGEVVGRRWLATGSRTAPEVLAARIADLAWSGLRGVHRIPPDRPEVPLDGR